MNNNSQSLIVALWGYGVDMIDHYYCIDNVFNGVGALVHDII